MNAKFSESSPTIVTSEGSFRDFYRAETKNKSDYSIAGRVGVAFDRLLIYGKAGWVWGRFDVLLSEGETCTGNQCTSFLDTLAASGTLNGPLFGIGLEYALTDNWTTKLEYNYLNYGASELGLTGCSSIVGSPTLCSPAGTSSFSADKHIFKFGVNYKFNFGQSIVVAKY